MGRLIKLEGAGKERTQLLRGVALAIRELMSQSEPDQTTRDLAAFIALALGAIAETIEPSVLAWEKRGYWIKADRFRLEWSWTESLGQKLRSAVLNDDWGQVAILVAQVADRVNKIKVPTRHRLGAPWSGSYIKLFERP